jgi:hypothetical protein
LRCRIKSLYDNKSLTGGDSSGENLAGLESIFRNPVSYNILPYLNKYNSTGDYVYTGFFIPTFSVMP